MANKTKFGFGSSEKVQQAIQDGLLNGRDILLLDEDTDNPKIGWIKTDGTPVILTDEKADLTEIEAEVAELETELALKASAEDVAALEDEVAAKVDAETVKTMIEEYSESVIEVVEF